MLRKARTLGVLGLIPPVIKPDVVEIVRLALVVPSGIEEVDCLEIG